MIVSFGDTSLRLLWQGEQDHGIHKDLAPRVERCLKALNVMHRPSDLPPGMRCKKFRGQRDLWQIMVSGTWRIRFVWQGGNCHDVVLRNDK